MLRFGKKLMVLAVASALAGCTIAPAVNPLSVAVLNPDVKAACEAVPAAGLAPVLKAGETQVNPEYVKQVLENPDRLDQLLDCTLLKITPGEVFEPELKLLRGHVLISLAARYGAFNVTGQVGPVLRMNPVSYSEQPADAAEIMDMIHMAELGMRHASFLFNAPTASSPPTPTPRTARLEEQVAPLLVLAVKAEQPTLHRGVTLAKTVASAIAGDPINAVKTMEIVANSLLKSAVVRVAGEAMLLDARENLRQAAECARGGNCMMWQGSSSQRANALRIHWGQWDKGIMDSCRALARVAGNQPHCIPSAEEIQAGFVK